MADVKATWASVIGAVRNALLGVPAKAKQRIPHLAVAEVGVITDLIREALGAVADGREETSDGHDEAEARRGERSDPGEGARARESAVVA